MYWLGSSGELNIVHQPELLTASEVRTEVTRMPIAGTSHSRQSAATASWAAGLANPSAMVIG